MPNSEINEYLDSAVVPDNLAEFDMDNWTGSAFLSTRIKWQDLQAAFVGSNLGNANLISTLAVRTFQLFGNSDSEQLAFKNSDGFNSLVINGEGDAFNHGLQGETTNTVFGLNTGRLATAEKNTTIGVLAMAELTIGPENTAVGYQAGRYQSGTTTINDTGIQGVFIGANASPSKTGNTNEIVIGFNSAGAGSNTTTLGSATTTNTNVFGIINSPAYSGVGDRNLIADTNGNLVIGTANADLIVHGATLASFPGTGSIESVYIADDTDFMYIWDADSSAYKKVGNEDIYNADGQLSDNVRNLNLKLDTAAAILDFRNLSGNSIIKIDGLRDIYLENLKAPTGSSYGLEVDDTGKISSSVILADTYINGAALAPSTNILTLSHFGGPVTNVTVDLSSIIANVDTLYSADGTVGAGRVATVTDTMSFDGGSFHVNRTGAGTLLQLTRTSDAIDRLKITDNASDFRANTFTFDSISGNGNVIIKGGNEPKTTYNTDLFGDTLIVRGKNKPEIEAVNSGLLSIVTSIGTGFGTTTYSPSAMVEIEGAGLTGTTYGLKVHDDAKANLNFHIKDNGEVSSRLGYYIDSDLYFHNNGVVNNVFAGSICGENVTGLGCVAIGRAALWVHTTGTNTTAIGSGVLQKSTINTENTGVGSSSMTQLLGGANNFNSALGAKSLNGLTAGSFHVSIGASSGGLANGGDGCTFLGAVTGFNVAGSLSNSIALGRNSKITASNQLVIGGAASGAIVTEMVIGQGAPDINLLVEKEITIRTTNIEGGAGNTDEDNLQHFLNKAGAGTGTGLGGEHRFEVAPATTTGDGQNAFIRALTIKESGIINAPNVPTSATGLVAGDIWSNAGILTIV